MIDLDQARTRAKEHLARLRLTDERDQGPRLADAQHHIAGELGYRSWPDLVRDNERFDLCGPDEVPLSRVRRVSVVCFIEDAVAEGGAVVVLHRHDGRWTVPTGDLERGEDAWDDAVLRIPLHSMGFRRQGTHPFALDKGRRHVVFWVTGGRYTGTRLHHADPQWWTGPPAEASELLAAQGDGALARLLQAADADRNTMTYERDQADLHRTLVGAYLRADTPQGGSGFGGSEQEWRQARGVLADALEGLGTDRDVVHVLDHCCANGHLAVSLARWGAERGIAVEPYGVDVAVELVERARGDHPQLADRFHVGDALTWRDPDGRRFDLVHMLYDVVPSDRWAQLTTHLLEEVVAPGGRLLVSHYGELPDSMTPESIVARLGHRVAGRTRVPVRLDRPRGFPSVWIDA